jgi:predicted nucleic acid-binding protein
MTTVLILWISIAIQINSGSTLPIIAQLYDKETPDIYFSSIGAQELLAGARSPAGRRNVGALLVPFERTGRIVTPGHQQWSEAGDMLAGILTLHPDLRNRLPGLVNDCLLALSALGIGATVYTRNRNDFVLLRQIRPFSLVLVG